MDYPNGQDPRTYVSQKTNRGPLSDNWLAEHWNEVKGKPQPTAKNMSLMCAYKLCRVEFRYWGMQTKLEKFIHDTALRKTMQAAHCQAWVWQDEWYGLTMDDIREIERQTQLALKQKMQALEAAANGGVVEDDTEVAMSSSGSAGGGGGGVVGEVMPSMASSSSTRTDIPSTPVVKAPSDDGDSSEEEEDGDEDTDDDEEDEANNGAGGASSSLREDKSKTDYFGKPSGLYSGGSKNTLHSPLGSAHSFDLQVRSVSEWVNGFCLYQGVENVEESLDILGIFSLGSELEDIIRNEVIRRRDDVKQFCG